MFFNVSIFSLGLAKISLIKLHVSLRYLGKATGEIILTPRASKGYVIPFVDPICVPPHQVQAVMLLNSFHQDVGRRNSLGLVPALRKLCTHIYCSLHIIKFARKFLFAVTSQPNVTSPSCAWVDNQTDACGFHSKVATMSSTEVYAENYDRKVNVFLISFFSRVIPVGKYEAIP